ncbi:sigma-70 family RNA polymerase sigma factor [Companilactobacillus furfuricola]|uniref:sigma-70 family RNA polymerase sigma factor n=1 Tax=Companilactobacillus furfuricola TaxID=1462575 RepID=UPI000F7A7EE1|nr:sigma-70 family RNA polymerase sigma factor [Companilactobacillus furfuricola]
MDLQVGFKKALEEENLVHGVLKKLHIYQTNNNYQDYVQEAMIIFAQAYVDYVDQEQDLEKFNVYIYQKLSWRLTDMLRKEQRFFNVHSLEVFDFERVKEELSDLFLDDIDLSCLNEFEQKLFFDLFIDEIPIKFLTKKYGCTARNLRYHRDSIRQKMSKLLS